MLAVAAHILKFIHLRNYWQTTEMQQNPKSISHSGKLYIEEVSEIALNADFINPNVMLNGLKLNF